MQIQLRAGHSPENLNCMSNLSAHEALITTYFTGQMTTTRHSVDDVTQQKLANKKLVIYRLIQKSPYVGNVVSLFTKRAIHVHRYIGKTNGCVPPVQGDLIWTHLVLCAHMRLCVLLGDLYFVFPPDIAPVSSNAPSCQNLLGWGLEIWEATPRDHSDQSNDLETAI
jgi:hypothetical protein